MAGSRTASAVAVQPDAGVAVFSALCTVDYAHDSYIIGFISRLLLCEKSCLSLRTYPFPAHNLPPCLPLISEISTLGYTFLLCEDIPPATVKTICFGVNEAYLLGAFHYSR